MKARSVALLMLALGCGLVASIGITQVIGNREPQPADTTGDTDAIFVAMEEIPFGEPLTPQVLRLESWPKDKVPAGTMSRIEDIEGRRTRTRLYAGEPILENKLFAKGSREQGYSTVIPKGYRVVAVKVDRVSGSGLILPSDRVDVLVHLTKNPPRGILKTSTRTILQNVKVFAVNDVVDSESQDEKTMAAQTISLLVKPENAQLVMLAEELGKIRLVMRSPDDADITAVKDTTPSELLDAAENEDAQREELLAQAGLGKAEKGPAFLDFLAQLRTKKAPSESLAPAVPTTDRHHLHRMRIVSGAEVKDVVLQMDEDRSDAAAGLKVWKVSDSASFSGPEETAPATEPTESPTDQEPQDAAAEQDPLQSGE